MWPLTLSASITNLLLMEAGKSLLLALPLSLILSLIRHAADYLQHGVAERHVKGVACLGSGYDFVRENSYLHVPGNFMAPQYDSAMLAYWKGYLKQHKQQLSCAPGIDLEAGLHASSVEVQPQPALVITLLVNAHDLFRCARRVLQ